MLTQKHCEMDPLYENISYVYFLNYTATHGF